MESQKNGRKPSASASKLSRMSLSFFYRRPD
jgi:hypothetical protein